MRGKRGVMKKPEAERLIRQLTHEWATVHGIRPGATEQPVFGAFRRWAIEHGHEAAFEFRSTMGPLEDAESWFDQELRQAWRI